MSDEIISQYDYLDIQKMDEDQLVKLADEIRKKILVAVSSNGGHLSSNLGVIELTIALLKSFDLESDDLLFDVGHQTYAFKLLTKRNLALLRKKDGISGFQDIDESHFDKMMGGHSSTSLSIGMGMAAAKKLEGDTSCTVCVIGDASLASGIPFEALNSFKKEKYSKLIVIINDNGMSISNTSDAMKGMLNRIRNSIFYQSRAGKFKKAFDRKRLRPIYTGAIALKRKLKKVLLPTNYFDFFDFAYLGPIDGNNIHKTVKFIERSKQIDGPVILHLMTKKGKGYKYSEEDKIGVYHGVGPFNLEEGYTDKKDENSGTYCASKAIYELLKKDPKAVLICPAMVYNSILSTCFETFSERCFDPGISEEHVFDFATGLALKGAHPIVSIYSTFMQRSYDEIYNDASRMKADVLTIIERSGLVGEDGSSHQGINDLALLETIPNVSVYQPLEANLIDEIIINHDFSSMHPSFVRIEKGNYISDKEYSLLPYIFKKGMKDDVAFIGVGSEFLKCLALLEKGDMFFLTKLIPLDCGLLERLLNYKTLVIYDPTSIKEGLSSNIAMNLIKRNYRRRIIIEALDKAYYLGMKKEESLKQVKLDADSILNKYLDR